MKIRQARKILKRLEAWPGNPYRTGTLDRAAWRLHAWRGKRWGPSPLTGALKVLRELQVDFWHAGRVVFVGCRRLAENPPFIAAVYEFQAFPLDGRGSENYATARSLIGV